MLNVFAENPRELLNAICTSVREGEVDQWELHQDGSFRFTGKAGRLRNQAKLEPKHYRSGVTFSYRSVRAKKLETEIHLRATLHSRMLELLAKHFLGDYSYVVFEPRPLR